MSALDLRSTSVRNSQLARCQSADVPYLMAHDGLANIVFDADVEGQSKYMVFMRTYDLSKTVKLQARRVSRMVSKTAVWGGEGSWEKPVEILRGESGYEIYELRPWRLKSWRPGFYFGIGMYETQPTLRAATRNLSAPSRVSYRQVLRGC